LDFGVLLGDIVVSPSRDNYDRVIECMKNTGKPYYAIPGNHDGEGMGLALFLEYFGKTEQYFRYKNNLFILLNPEEGLGGIGGGGQV
jgi:3',5'-cyclic AMP phosphodiesterase CpdA